MLIVYGLISSQFRDQRIQLYLKSLKINIPFQEAVVHVIDVYILSTVVVICDKLRNLFVLIALYKVSFFFFLKIIKFNTTLSCHI